MIEHLSSIHISLYVAFLVALCLTMCCVTCLVIGYVLGRNSAEKPIVHQKEAKPPKLRDDEIVMPIGEGDYIMDEIEDLEGETKYAGRVATM